MIEGRKVSHPWFGVTDAGDLPSAIAHAVGINGGVEAGEVEPGSPASAAGMTSNDILVSFDGKQVDSPGDLVADVNACTLGDRVPITYVHNGRTVSTTVKLTDEPVNG
jgi:S1-C subfamily serine protease